MVQIRFWHQGDLPALLQMAAQTAWEITPPADRIATQPERVWANAHRNLITVLNSPGGTAVVADEGGQAVGYLLIGLRPDDRTGEMQGYMADIYLQPAFRGRRLAEQLHRVGEEYLRRLGIRRTTNWVHAHNELGKKASEYYGFQLASLMLEKRVR